MLALIWSRWPAQLEKIRWKIPQMLIIDQVFQSLNQFSNGFSAFDSYVWNDAKWQRNCSVLLIAFYSNFNLSYQRQRHGTKMNNQRQIAEN